MSQAMLSLDDTDRDILRALMDGRGTPLHIADKIDKTRQSVQNHLRTLVAAGYVRKVNTGLYEITDDGRATLNETD